MDLRSTRRQFLQQSGLVAAAGALAGLAPEPRAVAGAPEGLRAQYDIRKGLTYFNHASMGASPRRVRAKCEECILLREGNPWLYLWGHGWDEQLDEARALIGETIGCDTGAVALARNTEEACHIIASGLPLGAGDEVLYPTFNHFSTRNCFLRWGALKGYTCREFAMPVAQAPTMSVDQLVSLYTDDIRPHTRALVIPHVDYYVGIHHPIAEISAAAHDKGVEYVIVDGAQIVGMLPIDMRAGDVDFYVASAHKWMQSAKGVGFLCCREGRLAEVTPMWAAPDATVETAADLEARSARDAAVYVSLQEAVQFNRALLADGMVERLMALRSHAESRAAERSNVQWLSPTDQRLATSIYTIKVGDGKQVDLLTALRDDHGFVLRAFDRDEFQGLRLSLHAMNTTEDLDRFFETIDLLTA